MPPRALLSWSSGKDCAFALHVLRRDFPHIPVVALLTTFNEENSRVAMHATRLDVVRAQAAAVGLPLWRVDLPSPCSNAEYARRMAALYGTARARGITHVAFGDLHLADVRAYREMTLEGTGLVPLFPLWVTPGETRALAAEMIAAGAAALVCTVDAAKLPAALCGRIWDAALVDELVTAGVDACGERGEFHSIAVDGPAFAWRVAAAPEGAPFERGAFYYVDVALAGASPLGTVDVHIDAAAVDAALAAAPALADSVAAAAAKGEAICPTVPVAATLPPPPPPLAPLRIVSAVPAGTTIAFALGLGKAVAGVTHECRHPPEAAELPRLLTCAIDSDALTGSEIDTAVASAGATGAAPLFTVDASVLASAAAGGARLLVLSQDLCVDVCGPGARAVAAAVAAMPPSDAPPPMHVTLRAASLDGVYDDVIAVATAAGVPERGARLVSALRARVAAVGVRVAASLAAGAPRPRVVCLEWLDPVYNSGHWVPEAVRLAGGEDVFGTEGAFSVVRARSEVLAAAPDVVLAMPCGFDCARAARDVRAAFPELLPRPVGPGPAPPAVWAVDAHRFFSGASPHLVDGIELLATLFFGSDVERAAIPAGDAQRVV